MPTDFVSRMEVELHELNQKLKLLTAFMETSQVFQTLPPEDKALMLTQQSAMCTYSGALTQRLERARNQKKN